MAGRGYEGRRGKAEELCARREGCGRLIYADADVDER